MAAADAGAPFPHELSRVNFSTVVRNEFRLGESRIEPDMTTLCVGKDGRMTRKALTLAGAICLTLVVLTHVAEHFHLVPIMGWGLPDSPGHYLDLISAILGIVLLLAALAWRR